MRRPDELDHFKTSINLAEYAASSGYVLDRKSSSRNSAVMEHPGGDKIIIARGHDGHWTFFSVRDSNDSGSIVDFMQKRESANLGQVRKILRSWAGVSPPSHARITLEPVARDLAAVRALYQAARTLPSGHHSYLNLERNVPYILLASPRLADRVRTDERKNALFPHFNRDGLCGFEVKNAGFTGFSKHGVKGLWCTAGYDTDRRLIIAESAIDALSYASLFSKLDWRLFSTGGAMNPDQPGLIVSAIQKMPAGTVIIAADNDPGGDEITAAIRECFREAERADLTLQEHRPPLRGQDWNDIQRQQAPPAAPSP